jgi:hypothetical protein
MNNKSVSQQGLDNHANQLNPTHPAYHRARGVSPEEAERLASEAQAAQRLQPEANPGPQTGGANR